MLAKKAQVSIEVLAILSILVVGAVLFGVYYLNSINKSIGTSSKLLEDGFSQIIDDPYHVSGDDPDIDTYSGRFDIDLELIPVAPSSPNTPFGIKVTLNGIVDMAGDINVTEIVIVNPADPITPVVCSYESTPIINGTLANQSILIGNTNTASTTLNFSCATEGNYNFTITAKGIDTNNDIKSVPKTISKVIQTSVPSTFSVKIVEPLENSNFFIDTNTNFIATTSPVSQTEETDTCVWYVNEKTPILNLGSQTNSCILSNVRLLNSIFAIGKNKITVYATRTGGTQPKTANATININIFKQLSPGILYLSTPRNVFVLENFNVKVYGSNQPQVNAVNYEDFSFTDNNCEIDNTSPPLCGSINILGAAAIVNTIHYCDYSAVCLRASYSQTAPHNLTEITASLSGTEETAKLFSQYDLFFNSGNCNISGTEYGILQACISPFSEGYGYNEDYWNDSSYGFLKAYVDNSTDGGAVTDSSYGAIEGYVS